MDFKINIKQPKNTHSITLHKINKQAIGQVPSDFLDSLTRSINDIDTIQLTIPRYVSERGESEIGIEKKEYPLYNEFKNERYLCINQEYFIIKKVTENNTGNNKTKTVEAHSGEIKLSRTNIKIEDVGLQIYTGDEELGIISLKEYLYQETGWTLGYVDEKVAYDKDEEGNLVEKMRWQESTDSSWYDFINGKIKESFDCFVFFDTYGKTVNLFHLDEFGDNLQLYLSHDNYIKSLTRTDDSMNIVTRLELVGNEEMDIIGATATGYKYIEDYSYFIDNGEMSEELIDAINLYNMMLEVRNPIWEELVANKTELLTNLARKKTELYSLYADLKTLNSMKDVYKLEGDLENEMRIIAQITEKNDQKVILEKEVEKMEEELVAIQKSIEEINILCKRETATDYNGDLIFTDTLLEELKEFVYYDVYSNDSFLDPKDLIETGKRELSLKSQPTCDWTVDVVNFLERILDIGIRQHWNGEIGLGDVIVLHERDTGVENFIYFVGYTQDFKGKSLKLDLSNKKNKTDNTKVISDLLGQAKRSTRALTNNRYLWIQQKKNRINLEYSKGGR